MKIGFSFGRCVRDIVNGRVAYDDVLMIVAATYVEDLGHLEHVVDSYLQRRDYLRGLDRDQCLAVAQRLWADEKIIQPRREGIHRTMAPDWAVWADLAISPQATNPAIESAWQQYRMLVDLCGQAQHAPPDGWEHLKL